MNTLNSILIEGNVVRDAETKETPKGSLVCNFTIASNRYYRQADGFEQETSFFDVESWLKLAETCGKNCRKGRGVRIVGRIKQERWNGTDGKAFSRVKIVADHVEFRPLLKDPKVPDVSETGEIEFQSVENQSPLEIPEPETEAIEAF